jgi:hypothetical protein
LATVLSTKQRGERILDGRDALAPDPSCFMQSRGYGLESIRESTISPLEAAFSALGGTTR